MLEAHLSQNFSLEMYIVLAVFLAAIGIAGWTVWQFVKIVWREIWS